MGDLAGGCGINVLARGRRVVVWTLAWPKSCAELPIMHRKVAPRDANMAWGRARVARRLCRRSRSGSTWSTLESARGVDVICLGEMGIGNHFAASAIVATLTTSSSQT